MVSEAITFFLFVFDKSGVMVIPTDYIEIKKKSFIKGTKHLGPVTTIYIIHIMKNTLKLKT
jgi:hypothetical protein